MKDRNFYCLFAICCCGFMFMVQGCQSYHMHRVKNISNLKLYDVTVTSKGRSSNHGVLIPNAGKGYGGSFELDKRNEIEISWHCKETGATSKRLMLDENPGSREVVFNIDGENVSITYESY